MVNYITDIDDIFFNENQKILDNYPNIFDIRLVGSVVRNKKTKINDFDIAVLLKDNVDNVVEIRDYIKSLQTTYYPKLDVMFWNKNTYNKTLINLKTLNKSAYDELSSYPYFSIKNKRCVNFKYDDEFKPYKISPWRCFMVPVLITVWK